MKFMLILEISATVLGLIYLILLIKENIWCWFFGAISSLLSIILFYYSQLYSEAILYFYYVVMAGYGYTIWSRQLEGKPLEISQYPFGKLLKLVILSALFGLCLGFGFYKWTDADLPFIDSQTTMFSFLATYLEAHKILSGWIIWIIVNGLTIGIYAFKGLFFYSGLMLIYFVLSILGYYYWKKKLQLQ